MRTNLHTEEDLVLPLELGDDGDEVGFEQPRNVRLDEPVEPNRVRLQPLELLCHDQAFLPHLLLPPPDREAGARSRARPVARSRMSRRMR